MDKTKSKFADWMPPLDCVVEITIPINPDKVHVFKTRVNSVVSWLENGIKLSTGTPITKAVFQLRAAPPTFYRDLAFTDFVWRMFRQYSHEPVIVQVDIVE